jgi:exopolysaccharide biosynthesis WecB/TagA/CpsF family protein
MNPPSVTEQTGTRVPRVPLLGLTFDPVTMPEAIGRVAGMIASGRPHRVVTANVDFTVLAGRDPHLRSIIAGNDMVVCDGMPLVWASRWFGRPLPERVAGSDMVPMLLREAEVRGWRVYFLGGAPEVLDAAVAKVRRRHPCLEVAGHESPPYQPLDQMDHEGICRRIRESRADLVLVSFGCPKQERWIDMNYRECGGAVCIGVGATIDFLAGAMKRAPRWMQLVGGEWVFRMLQEPRRLGKRYATDLLGFATGCLRELAAIALGHASRAARISATRTNAATS